MQGEELGKLPENIQQQIQLVHASYTREQIKTFLKDEGISYPTSKTKVIFSFFFFVGKKKEPKLISIHELDGLCNAICSTATK